jgi:hypothetical protein
MSRKRACVLAGNQPVRPTGKDSGVVVVAGRECELSRYRWADGRPDLYVLWDMPTTAVIGLQWYVERRVAK